MTAEDAEKNAKKDVLSYYKNMASNIVLGILALILLFILPFKFSNIFILLFALLWLIEPYIMCKISKEYKIEPKVEELNQGEKEYL